MSEIRTVAVCGAGGTMGAGIAIVAARAGFSTICYDVAMPALDRAARQTDGFFAKSVQRGKMSAADKDAVLGRLTPTTSLEALAKADLVIEAVFEDLAVKRELFDSRLSDLGMAQALIADNEIDLHLSRLVLWQACWALDNGSRGGEESSRATTGS